MTMADEVFTDEEIEFLRTDVSEEHAKAARWLRDGMPGFGRGTLSGDPQADTERAIRAAERAGSEATGIDPEKFHATLNDAMTIIRMRRDAAERHGQQWFDDFMRMRSDGTLERYRAASDAEKQKMEEDWRAGRA
jgi:hypothetical protein